MSRCSLLELAQERRLDPDERVLFEGHLVACPSCRDAMKQWRESRHHLDTYFAEHAPDPSSAAKARLLLAADDSVSLRSFRWGIPISAAAIAAAIALLLYGFPSRDDSAKAPSSTPSGGAYSYQLIYPESAEATRSITAQRSLRGVEGGYVVRFRNTLLGMDPATEIQVVASTEKQNRFVLTSGVVAVELPLVAHREHLSIEAGPLTVFIKGTLFWVELVDDDQVEVGVLRGKVSVVADDGQTWTLTSGTRLSMQAGEHEETGISDAEKRRAELLLDPNLSDDDEKGALDGMFASRTAPDTGPSPREKTKGSHPSHGDVPFATIEQWILQRQFTKAELALQRRLSKQPSDRAALDLLATCYRKQGKFNLAADVYGKLTAMGSAASMNRARYKLSVIYQENLGDHDTAVEILKTYLAASPQARPNTLEARLRLARSLERLGRTAEYRQALETIVTAHPGTEGAQKAKALLAEAR